MSANIICEYHIDCISKGQKYWNVSVTGKKSSYQAKILIESLPDLTVGEHRTIYATFENRSDKYGKEYYLIPATLEECAASKKQDCERWWGYVQQSYEKGYIYEKGVAKLRELGCTDYDAKIVEMRANLDKKKKQNEIDRWWGYVQNAATQGYVYEKGVAKLHALNCYDYDTQITEIREKIRKEKEAKNGNNRVFREGTGYDSDWAAFSPIPGTLIWRDDKVYEIVKVRHNFYDGFSFGMNSEDWYEFSAKDITNTEEGKKFIENRKARLKKNSLTMRMTQSAKAIAQHIKCHGTLYDGTTRSVDGEVLFDYFTVYGGGYKVVIPYGENTAWYILNNGADGDDWSKNNITTGGAGAYGYYTGLTDDLKRLITGYKVAKEAVDRL